MNFRELFELFYTKFRGEENPPAITDPEWQIAVRNYNDALQRLANYDDTKWDFLYGSNQVDGVDKQTVASQSTYATPTDMYEYGGLIKLDDTQIPVIKPYEVSIQSIDTPYAYFTGDLNSGYTLHISPTPTTIQDIEYTYYKNPPRLDATTEDGTTKICGGDPAYYYNSMLAQRFLDSRNFPAYQIAKRDAETALSGMRLKNYSGSWYNSWTIPNVGATWGN